jgi:hypothetical protein
VVNSEAWLNGRIGRGRTGGDDSPVDERDMAARAAILACLASLRAVAA